MSYTRQEILYAEGSSRNKEIVLGKNVGWLLRGYFPYRGWRGLSGRLPN